MDMGMEKLGMDTSEGGDFLQSGEKRSKQPVYLMFHYLGREW
jgi:hypothetical protein